MAKHNVAYSASEQLRRYEDAVGPNKLFGTGAAVVRCYRLLAGGNRISDHFQVNEVLDILQTGMDAAIEASFEAADEE